MSKAVDDRVVSLEFDNAQFEKSVNETLKMLENLKKSLKFDKAAENLSAITDAGKKVDLASVGESVDKLNDKFTTMRLVGLMALSSLVEGAMQMAKKIGSVIMAPFNQIKSGGWARAMKIEDAKFMLEGLQVKWDSISKDINYGVADTAYGLDEAAKAASQLVASGVKFGETYGETGNSPMAKALRGISGVAAMTNSTYEEISSIFTTVAGQGKMMTMQLRQLESRGLNVAATMVTQFNKVADGTSTASEKFQESVKKMTKGAKVNEAAIRDMIQKGKVDFAIFSEAMDEAFGQHAKDANNTFTGALANVKAALSKIGAEFATPLIQDAIPVLNAVRKMINAIKTNMTGSGGIFDLFRTMSRGISNIFTSKIERITDFLTNRFTGITNINRGLWLVMTNIVKVVKTIKTAFQKVFGGNTGDHVNRMAEGFEKLAWALTPTDAALKGFGDILTVVFSIIKKVGDAIGWLISKLGGPILVGFFKIINVILTLIGRFGDLISVVFEFVRGFGDANSSIKLLEERFGISSEKAQRFYAVLSKVKDVLKKVGEVAKTALKYLAIGVAAIVVAPIYLLYQGFLKLTQMDWSKFINALKNAKALIIEFFNAFKQSPIVQGALHGIETALGLVVGAVIYLGEKIAEFFSKLANGEITVDSIKDKIASIPDSLKAIGDKIGGFFKQNKFFSPVVDGLKKLGGKIKDFVVGLPGLLKSLTPAKVMLITFSAAMVLLSVKANAVADVFVKLAGHLFKWYKIDSVLERKLNATLKTIGSFTQAILALTASIYILSKIPNLKETTIILGSFIGALALIGVIYTLVNRFVNGKNSGKSIFWQFSRDLTLMALGVYLVSGALVKISDINLDGIAKKIAALIVTLTALMGVSVLFNNPKWNLLGTNGLSTLLSMVGYAIAIYAAASAIKKLDGVDLSGLQGKWPELLAILVGLALTAKAIAGVGLGIFTGAIAFFIGFSYITKQMEKYALNAANSTAKLVDVAKTIKDHLLSVGDIIKQMWNGLLDAFKEDFWGTFSAVLVKVTFAAIVIVGIIAVIRRIIPSFVAVSKEGKYAKRAAKGFLTIALAIAGLMLVAKFIADGMKDNPDAVKNLAAVVGMIALLIVAVGAMAMLTGIGSNNFSAGSIKQIRRTFSSLALLFLSMAALSAVIADMSPEEFQRAREILGMALLTISIMTAIIAGMTVLSKGSKAGFGTFAGVTLLFATMLGALALLMHMFDNMDDYSSLWKALGLITGVFVLIGGLFYVISKIRYNAAAKVIGALIAGMVVIGIAIAVLARQLPEEGYIAKVITISVAMVAVLSALIVLAAIMTRLAKKTKFNITKKSKETLAGMLIVLGALVVGVVAISHSLATLKDANPTTLIANAGIVLLVITALSGLMVGLVALSKHLQMYDALKMVGGLLGMSIIFSILAKTVMSLGAVTLDWKTTLTNIGLVMAVLLGLTGILAICNAIAMIPGSGLGCVVQLAILTGLFAALALVVGLMDRLVSSDINMIMQKVHVVSLLLTELTAILALCNVIALIPSSGLGCVLQLVILTAVFGALALVVGLIDRLMGNDITMIMKKVHIVSLLLAELTAIIALCGAIALYTVGGLSTALIVTQLILLTAVFGALALIVGLIDRYFSTDINMIMEKVHIVSLLLTELTGILALCGAIALYTAGGATMIVVIAELAALGLIFAGLAYVIYKINEIEVGYDTINTVNILVELMWAFIRMLAVLGVMGGLSAMALIGVVGLGALVLELYGLVKVLKELETVDASAVSEGLVVVAEAIKLLCESVIAMTLLSAPILVILALIVAAGLACLVAAPGITAFGEALGTLADNVASLPNAGKAIKEFFNDINEAASNMSAATIAKLAALGFVCGDSFWEGFHNGAQWHSPPQPIVDFFADCNVAMNQEAGKYEFWKWFEGTGETWGSALAKGLTNKLGGADVTSMLGSAGFNLGNITGMKMENGIMPSIGNIQNALMSTLNLSNMVANSLNLASKGYSTTQSMYMDQLNHEYKSTESKLKAVQENLAYVRKYGNGEVDKTWEKNLTNQAAVLGNELYKIQEKMDGVSGATKDATSSIEDFSTSLGGGGAAAKDFASSLKDTLESQMNIFSKFEQKQAMSKEELLGNMRSQIEGMTNWAAQMADLATKGIDKGLYQKLAEMGPQGAEYVGAFANMTAEELAEANTLWAQSLVLPGQAAAMVTGSFNSIGTNVVKGYANGISGNVALATNAGLELAEDTSDAVDTYNESHSPSKLYERKGLFIVQGLAHGIEKNQKRAIEAMEVMCQAMVMKAETILNKDNFISYGINIVDGLTEGLGDEEANKKLSSKIREVSKSLKDTFTGPEEKGGNEIKSPSKVFYRFGKYIDEGLANGISDYTGKVVASTEDLSGSTLDAMRYTVANIAAMVNNEMEDPVITPILDLSNVQAGVRTLNSVLAGNRALAAGINEDGTIQNGKSSIGGTTFIQNNYSPKALSRAEIYRQTNNQFARFRQSMG